MNRIFTTLTLCFCCLWLAAESQVQQPSPQSRQKETINESWYFCQGDPAGAEQQATDHSAWQHINLPHCWNATDSYQTKDYYRGPGWYRKMLAVPARYHGQRLYLRFDGASLRADVYVNGTYIGYHKGGYTAFSFDVTDHLRTDGPNILAVRVDNSEQDIPPLSADFTFFGGMYRDVWLIGVNPQHFDMDNMASPGVFIETPQVSEEKATVRIHGALTNRSDRDRKIELTQEIRDADDRLVSRERKNITLKAGKKTPFDVQINPVQSPRLWCPEDTYLYTVVSRLTDARSGQLIDELIQPLGFRWFAFDAQTGFSLNGRPCKLNGVCRHQDQQYLGSALTDDQHRRDMQLMRELGMNFFRISHYPQDDAILEQCDRMGLIAWEEIPVVNYIAPNEEFASNCETQLREMIRQHYNHPSVMMWGYMNEIMLGTLRKSHEPGYELLKEETARLTRHLEAVVHEEDPYRVSVTAQHENVPAYDALGLSAIPDVLGWNLYQGWYGGKVTDFGRFMDEQHRLHPERPHIISEYGAGSDIRIHSLEPECFDFSIEYQQYYTEEIVRQINERPYIAGASMWNFIDFGSAVREETMPHVNNKGIVYANRRPKDLYYYYQAVWSEHPVLHIASRDWMARTGISDKGQAQTVEQPVKVYSNLAQVELWVNGTSLGTRATDNCHAIWNVPFRNGNNILTAKGRTAAGEWVEDVLKVSFRLQPSDLTLPQPDLDLGVNVGSTAYFTDANSGYTWVPDRPYSPGSWGYVGGEIHRSNPSRLGIQAEVAGTDNQPLYQTLRQGLEEYRFDVPRGRYEVELLFADPQEKGAVLYDLGGGHGGQAEGGRSFSVQINEETVWEDLNLQKQYGALFAVARRYTITTQGSEGISVKFRARQGETLLNGIRVRVLR